MLNDARIVINGVELTQAQSSSIRVAVANMLMELANEDHMKALGEIGPLYQASLSEVQDLFFKSGD